MLARWRRAGDEGFSVGPDNVAENLDLPLEACFSAASISSAPAALTAAVFLLGCMGHWNRDRHCEPAQLTGCLLGV